MKFLGFLFTLIVVARISVAQAPILSQREQAKLVDEITSERLQNLLPELMRKEGIDMWVIISRENNEDPVLKTMVPSTWISARETTMLIIYDKAATKETEYFAITRYDAGKVFKKAWDPDHQPDQWAQLAKIVGERNPSKIAINKSEHFGLADGISATEYEGLKKTLQTKKLADHIVSGERLAIAWLETRTEREMIIYQQLCRITHDIVAEALSEKVIVPGISNTDDVTWWLREKVKDLKLTTWFHPIVTVQREEPEESLRKKTLPLVIMPGDLVHVDFGITHLRLNTSTQQIAYVLKSGESEIPDYLKRALARGNKLQDILTKNFQEGKTGNQILADSRKQATDQGLSPNIFTHPIGFHGHGAGPTIGKLNMQNGIPHNGEYSVKLNTTYAVESIVNVFLIEWKKEIQIKLEENGYFEANGFRYIDGRQTEILSIPKSTVANR